jgi:hypothetical protein
MLPDTKGKGIARQPHWQVRFRNGAKIVSRLPGRDGKGVKGQHVIKLEIDEAQDYPLAGWIEIVECLNRGSVGAQWRVHGVSRGVRDKFYEYSHSAAGPCIARWPCTGRRGPRPSATTRSSPTAGRGRTPTTSATSTASTATPPTRCSCSRD